MRSLVSVRPVRHPRYPWRVNYPETLADGEKVRRQSFFTDRRSAGAFAAVKETELANHGARNSEITDSERRAVVHFRQWSASRPDAPSLLDLIREGIARAGENRPRLTGRRSHRGAPRRTHRPEALREAPRGHPPAASALRRRLRLPADFRGHRHHD